MKKYVLIPYPESELILKQTWNDECFRFGISAAVFVPEDRYKQFTEKKYVNIEINKIQRHEKNYFKVGHKVVVIDGSHMTNPDGEFITGIQFLKGNHLNDCMHELLEITKINIPFNTDYTSEILGSHNNCEIRSNDGSIYHCSKVNIIRYEL